MEEEKSEQDLAWERRVLCSDGNCIGVIGPDGTCKECGKPYDGDLPEGGLPLEEAGDLDEGDDASGADAEDSPPIETDIDEETDDEWDSRQLCSDGNCIGVIGPDGTCKECGKPFEG